ncbi:EamA family transporter [Variovorax sp. ZS18.2.2]|uniref:EamA family transporter n=1 Tax=Variovorax sp. ZS18.2.2 TaxID=2971255 RepID=UPI0021519468|nr:EamA family transporter [Variovorax sp. ZS18.2.2]MCR6478095.1 EamA family transporter [Variovorax sp. ZS18.2.2]
MLLAVLVAVIWGVAFVVSKIGLESFTPPQLTALRFLVAAVGVLWLPRPAISWKAVVFIGLTVFTGQFLLQFFGIAFGMPAGLTAFVVQTQALFTVVFAALMFGDRPSTRQTIGMVVALVGLLVIGLTLNGNVPVLAFALTLASALSWAVGNLVIKRLSKVKMLHLMAWASLVPPVPALALSFMQDGPGALMWAVTHASMWGLFAPVYLGLLATVLAYAIWGDLLQRYSASTVAPFALLAPAVGLSMSSLIYGESFSITRLAGMALLLIGVAIAAGLLNRSLHSAAASGGAKR